MSIDHCDTQAAAALVPGEGNAAPTVANGFGHLRPLPYPMRLGRKPIAMAMTASIVTTRMAAASISTSFSVA
jgi:hypothetical protein